MATPQYTFNSNQSLPSFGDQMASDTGHTGTPATNNTLPAATSGCSHDFKNIKAALSRINIDSILAEPGYQPLRIPGATFQILLRRRGVRDLRERLRRVQNKYGILQPGQQKAFNLLQKSLSRVLEQHAAYKAQPRTNDGYMNEILVLKGELNSLLGQQPACQYPEVFLDLISSWVTKAHQATAPPDPVALKETPLNDAASIPPVSIAAETAARRANAMDAEPTLPEQICSSLQASRPEDNVELSEEEAKALFPQKAIWGELEVIPFNVRRQGLVYICKRVIRMNQSATQNSSTWLSRKEIPELTHMMEYNILKSIHRDMTKESSPPTPHQIEIEYTKRVESKYEECGVLTKFLEKVKKFHRKIKKVQKWMVEKAAKFSCFGHESADIEETPSFGQTSNNQQADQASHMQHPQQPSPNPKDISDTRESLFAALRIIIAEGNASVSNTHNNGRLVLQPDQIDDMARKLEEHLLKDLNKKAEQTSMDDDQMLREYVRMGNDLLEKLKGFDFFVATFKQYFAMQG